MNFFNDLPVLLLLIGVVLLVVEFAVLGFSTIFLVFISFACFGTALLQWSGIVPETVMWSSVSVAVQTAAFGVLLWKPLHKLQSRQQDASDQPNTINGLEFRLAMDVSSTQHGEHQYSGITWQVEVDETVDRELEAGTLVRVSRSAVGKLFVQPVT